MGINYAKMANLILKMLKTGEMEKIVKAKDWVKKMNALELKFHCFHIYEGYLYLVGIPKKNLRPTDILTKAMSFFKLGNITDFMV